MIDNSGIPDNAKIISKRIFDIKAKAESKVHGVEIDKVQFHEVGAVDSIVDIVGTAICYDYLDIDQLISCDVPTVYGKVLCACGELPVPAPAVKAVLDDSFTSEWLVPETFKKGFGSGKRDTGLPPLSLSLVAN